MNSSILKSVYKYIKFKLLNFKHIKLKYFKYVILGFGRNNFYTKLRDQKKIIVMQTPLHGNLGDQAIAYAQKKFIEDNFKDYYFFEVSFADVVKESKNIKSSLNNDDIIFIHGGGNLGDMYLLEELTRRYIIKFFEGTKIISFPQTVSFSNSLTGKRELEKTKKLYANHDNLLLIARESKSFNLMKQYFGEKKVIFTPDIVLSLSNSSNKNRQGILTCFRNDEEINLKGNVKQELISNLKDRYKEVIISDTVVNRSIDALTRESELNNIWNSFKSAEVVLTDRLHGMIFCAITGTPCIVFKNLNHKIEYSYNDWLKSLNYIKFVNIDNIHSTQNLFKIIDELKDLNKKEIKTFDSTGKFNNLVNYVNGEAIIPYEQLQ
ncbi:polysaccharide pyruvyl transferase family protein [Priestia aryabhattai]|uniref:polysaccharide pyruvyl transferase family protein n=1 Tax=Priestia aryabhattai TaxID=412384 RepID=UPI003D281FB5